MTEENDTHANSTGRKDVSHASTTMTEGKKAGPDAGLRDLDHCQ
jgi:hypothetical protein